MSKLDEDSMLAFRDELRKVAGPLNSVGGAASRFAQRQLHAVSGWKPKGGLDAIRAGAHDASEALKGAVHSGNLKHVGQAMEGARAANRAESMGLTSLPGYAKALVKNPGKALKADVAAQWHSGGVASKALGIGLPAAMLAGDIKRPENETGPGKGELIGRGIAGAAGGFLGSAMPLTGQIAMGSATGAVGGLLGRGVDRLRGRRPGAPPPPTHGQPTPPEQLRGSHVPTERTMSPAAMGQPPEGMTA